MAEGNERPGEPLPRRLRSAYGQLPFAEQIAFFRRKVPLPSEAWTQLYGAGHDHGFVVAGATRDALVTDFMKAVDEAISAGKSIGHFRQQFDAIVARHGWSYNGTRNWRSKVIYQTNLASSFAAGRRAQMLKMTDTHPYWMYVHSDAVKDPRPEHQAWHGMVLRWDDPFWRTHFPPNGWGCRCEVRAVNARQLRALGKAGPDVAPQIRLREVTVGASGPAPRTVKVPAGIDPGFEHAPGATSANSSTGSSAGTGWVQRQAREAMFTAPNLSLPRWQPVMTAGPADFGRPAQMPLFPSPALLAPRAAQGESMTQRIADMLGGSTTAFDVKGLPVAIDAEGLAAHLAKDARRSEYLPLLPDLLNHPWEVWVNLYRDSVSGKYELRTRILKAYALKNSGEGVLLVAQAGRGFFEGWTFIPTRDIQYVNRQRVGKLWYGAS